MVHESLWHESGRKGFMGSDASTSSRSDQILGIVVQWDRHVMWDEMVSYLFVSIKVLCE